MPKQPFVTANTQNFKTWKGKQPGKAWRLHKNCDQQTSVPFLFVLFSVLNCINHICSVVTANTLAVTITVQPSTTPTALKHIKTKIPLLCSLF